MARHGDTRSPSPVGSSYSASKRHHRDEDRYERTRRDDGRGHRRRSRTRSPDVGYTTYSFAKSNLCLFRNGIGIGTLVITEIDRGIDIEMTMGIARAVGKSPETDENLGIEIP